MTEIVLPYRYIPRGYQMPMWTYLEGGGRRYVGAWHRRAGKDRSVFGWIQKAMFKRPGLYWHVGPDGEQSRKFIWNNVVTMDDGSGSKFVDLFPEEIKSRQRDDQMLIETKNGSIYQCLGGVGSDGTAGHLRGPNPFGVVFSEYAFFAHDEAWDIVRPILNENGGWAIFISTPFGHNWFYDMVNRAQTIPTWKCEILTVDDTKRADGSPVITPEMIEEDRLAGMSEAKIQQEYYCSFESPFEGAIWGDDIRRIQAMGGITDVPWNPNLPVETWHDMGYDDPGAVWFLQYVGNERRFIDYHQQTNWSTMEWVKFLKDKPYTYSRHVAPWDFGNHNPDTGKRRIAFARDLGMRFVLAKKPAHIIDQIDAARSYLRRYRCVFDKTRCGGEGVQALAQYRWKKDRLGNPSKDVVKDALEHGAAAFRTGVTMDHDPDLNRTPRQTVADSDYDVLRGSGGERILTPHRQEVAMGDHDERVVWWAENS